MTKNSCVAPDGMASTEHRDKMSIGRRCVFEFPLAVRGHPHSHLVALSAVTGQQGSVASVRVCVPREQGLLPSESAAL